MDIDYIKLIIETLIKNGYSIKEIETVQAVNARKNGKVFELEDHIGGMVYSLLGNQRPWKAISENYDIIKSIFHNFDPNYLQNIDPAILVNEIRRIKCGNRSISNQMYSLNYNIDVFNKITSKYGSMDNYVTSDEPIIIANTLSSGEYKLKQMGIALVIEYLKNVGIDSFKPDTHIRRLFGKDRFGFSDKTMASEKEVLDKAKYFSMITNIPMVEIDSLTWQFCSSDYADICSASPKCEKCLVKTKCNYNKT